ncbi:hypothetical protein [Paenibacillus hamazuiensis]|uniref:hypothetical protein n=1 Tax=Paenibacillus hamazuiensis TaxID=2936508 RepID=UPI00200F7B77|nr:hypothetical protein [Paenibacillus hamazuiensis]
MYLTSGFITPLPLSSVDSAPHGKPKAIWLWHTSLIGTSEDRTDVLQFAANRQVGRIFLQVNTGVDPDDYRSFIRAASDLGIQVHALDGAPEWALPEHRQHIADLVRWVNSYNAASEESERFTGIQVDIEPYQLPEWTADRDAVSAQWLQSLVYFHELVKKNSVLTTAAAVPFWLDSVKLPDGSGTLSEAVMAALDETAVMSYRDQAEDVMALAGEELAAGDRLGKRVWIGVETNAMPDTPHITFYAKGLKQMEHQLALLDSQLKNRPSYAGIAVHDYAGWRALGD